MRMHFALAVALSTVGLADAASADEILIGVQLPLTGAVASWTGPVMKDGIQIAIDKLEAEKFFGDDRKLNVIFADNASDKTQAITLTSRFCDADKVDVIIGPPTTTLAAPAAPVANAKECPMIALNVGKESSGAGPWSFKGYDDPEKVMEGIGKYIGEKMKPESIHFVTTRDNSAVIAYRDAVVSVIKEAGVTNITEDTILASETDFTVLATKIVDIAPAALFVMAPPESAANIIIAARMAGLADETVIMGADYFSAPAFAEVGGEAVDGAIFPAHFSVERADEVNKTFVDAYRAKFGTDPDAYAAIAYNAFMMAAEAIKQVGPDASRQQIRDAIAGLTQMPSILGTGVVGMGAERSVVYDMLLVRNEGGKAIPLDQ